MEKLRIKTIEKEEKNKPNLKPPSSYSGSCCRGSAFPAQCSLLSLEGCLKPLKTFHSRFSALSLYLRSQFLPHRQRAPISVWISYCPEPGANVLWKETVVCSSNLWFAQCYTSEPTALHGRLILNLLDIVHLGSDQCKSARLLPGWFSFHSHLRKIKSGTLSCFSNVLAQKLVFICGFHIQKSSNEHSERVKINNSTCAHVQNDATLCCIVSLHNKTQNKWTVYAQFSNVPFETFFERDPFYF